MKKGCLLYVARLGIIGIHLPFRNRSRVLLQYDKQIGIKLRSHGGEVVRLLFSPCIVGRGPGREVGINRD